MKRNRAFTSGEVLVMALAMLPMSIASAQFIQTGNTPAIAPAPIASAPPAVSSSSSTWTQEVKDGEHSYFIQHKDGKYTVKVDGKSVPGSWIVEREGSVAVINDDGETVYVFRSMPKVRGGATQGFLVLPSERGIGSRGMNVAVMQQPKVMLGVNMSEPSDALRKHLKIGDKQHVILIDRVVNGLPAQQAGMEDYDVITSINGSDGASSEILHEALMGSEPGDIMTIKVLRAGEELELKPTLSAYDSEKLVGEASIGTWIDSDEDSDTDVRVWVDQHDGNEFELQSNNAAAADRDQRLHQEMMRRAEDALSRAHEQLLELRDGELYIARRKAEDAIRRQEQMLSGLSSRHAEFLDGAIDDRLGELEVRLNGIEDELHAQMDRMEGQMDRLMGMLEHMFDRLGEEKKKDE